MYQTFVLVTTSIPPRSNKNFFSVKTDGCVHIHLFDRSRYAEDKYGILFSQKSLEVTVGKETVEETLKGLRTTTTSVVQLLQNIQFCVSIVDQDKCDKLIPGLNSIANKCKELSIKWGSFQDLMISCKHVPEEILSLMNSAQNVCDEGTKLTEKYRKKAELLKIALKKDIGYVNYEEFRNLRTNADERLFLFLSEEFDGNEVLSNFELFLAIHDSSFLGKDFHIVDLDRRSNKTVDAAYKKPCIRHYSKNVLICADVFDNLRKPSETNYVRFNPNEKVKDPPVYKERALLEISCPVCPRFCNIKTVWRCSTCKNIVEYCYSGVFHCNCGYHQHYISFKCQKYYHKDYVPNTALSTMPNLENLPTLTEVNILLIGQSGVGKSTWINGIANYLRFPTLADAMKGKVTNLIPGQFTIYDDEQVAHKVIIGGDENEDTAVGVSATQACRSYVIYYKGQRVVLIDTPGLGDTRGYEQDSENVRDILKHLKRVPEIHAICFLLLPNETRSNASLKYSMKEILCYMHRSVIPNLLFVFTNARTTGYRPGETFAILQNIMEDTRAEYKFSPATVYMFDNESYRFLCAATKTSVKFSDSDVDAYKESWDKSSGETKRLLDYVAKRRPYKSKQSVELGWVRFKLLSLMKEELELSKGHSTEGIVVEIEQCEKKIETLKKHLYVNVEKIEETPFAPRLVCGTPSCCTARAGGVIYKICMEGCHQSTQFRTRPNAELLRAPVLSSMVCTTCSCRWEQHMVIDFSQKVVPARETNKQVHADIQKTKASISTWREKMKTIEVNKLTAAVRRETLNRFSKMLARYVAQHSIFLLNDAIVDYLDFIIHSLEMKPNKTELDRMQMNDLSKSKDETGELIKILQNLEKVEFVRTKSANYLEFDAVKKSLAEIKQKEDSDEEDESDEDTEPEIRHEKRVYV